MVTEILGEGWTLGISRRLSCKKAHVSYFTKLIAWNWGTFHYLFVHFSSRLVMNPMVQIPKKSPSTKLLNSPSWEEIQQFMSLIFSKIQPAPAPESTWGRNCARLLMAWSGKNRLLALFLIGSMDVLLTYIYPPGNLTLSHLWEQENHREKCLGGGIHPTIYF